MIDKMWLLIERPSPAEEPEVLGSSNDEDYIDTAISLLRSCDPSRDIAVWWKECVPCLIK